MFSKFTFLAALRNAVRGWRKLKPRPVNCLNLLIDSNCLLKACNNLSYRRPIGPPKVGGEEVIPYRKRRSTYD